MSAMDKVFPVMSRSQDTTVNQPKQLSCYSTDTIGVPEFEKPSINYYYLPDNEVDTNIDLQSGFSGFQFTEPANGIDLLLSSLMRFEKSQNAKTQTDIITWRGIMRSLLTLPFSNMDQVQLNVVTYDGQLFIDFDDQSIEIRKKEEQNRDESVKRMMYSGFKFESVATLPKPAALCSRKEIEGRFKKPLVNSKEQYCSVVKTGFGKTKLVLGAEVDCVWDYLPESGDPLPHYMELKTSKVINDHRGFYNFEKKLLNTWAQCFLVGIPRIVYGFRDDSLILRAVEVFKTEEIPIILKKEHFPNQPRHQSNSKNKCMDCIKFFSGLLAWLTESIPRDDDKSAWLVSFDPKTNKNYVVLKKMSDEQAAKLHDPETGMIKKEFREWRESLRK